jgi:glucosyl-3-phosphoglycerate synthase
LSDLLSRKGPTTISACVPALNEEPTIGAVTETLVALRDAGLVDEVLVIDSGSTDRTREVATDAGAQVVLDYEVLPELGSARGKGEAIFKGIAASSGEVICWLDADVTDFSDRFVLGLVGPLLYDPSITFVKAYYKRPLMNDRTHSEISFGSNNSTYAGSLIGEGGRVTELTARPLLAHLFPALSKVVQPLSGEYAGRRWLFEDIPLDTGYGVDVGILIDVFQMTGTEQMAECDLEIRHHRNRPLRELAPMAAEVSYAILRRVPALGRAVTGIRNSSAHLGTYEEELRLLQRPPLSTLRRSIGESGL